MRAPFSVTLLLSLLLLPAPSPAAGPPAEVWTSVRTKHFLLVGSAGAKDLRELAARLEQFREVCARLLDERHFDDTVPATVVVFRDDESYKPFKPLYKGRPMEAVSGHFQGSPEGDYLVLSVERRRGNRAREIAQHEYVHLLVKNSFRDAPLWFNEGLAEYYSTLRTSDGGQRVAIGRAAPAHALALKGRELLPLKTLFAVERESEHYNEDGTRPFFYAQSWALVHFLLTARRAELSRYLELLASGSETESAFLEAFKTDYAALENELKAYVRQGLYAEQEFRFEKNLGRETEMTIAPLSPAEARAVAGDLLLHGGRPEEAEPHLRRALALDPNLARAHASLGLLRVRQDKLAEAREHLARAVEADPQSYHARYLRAYALSREGADAHRWVTDYDPEAAELMRSELRKAVELAPHFVEAYRLHAFVNLVRGERLDESVALLKRALEIAPRRRELALLLAQVHLSREEFAEARRVLGPLADGSAVGATAGERAQARARSSTRSRGHSSTSS
ncbi:MAG TPA: tetratricopeptide repeat protein [Pyrinomonadaceae bacterium]|nr:tetratricopeptide repeat protein [Pyrinomonadaceae bacterium]